MSTFGCGASIKQMLDVSNDDIAVIEATLAERRAAGVPLREAQKQAVAEARAQLALERKSIEDAIAKQHPDVLTALTKAEVVAQQERAADAPARGKETPAEPNEPAAKTEDSGKPGQVAMFSRSGTPNAEAAALKTLSQADELFALPKSDKTTVEGILADNNVGSDDALTVKYKRDMAGSDEYTFTTKTGAKATMTVRKPNPYGPSVYESELKAGEGKFDTTRPGENPQDVPDDMVDVIINVSALVPGDFGNKIYNIASTYAHNNGMLFIGDPAGLSDAAMRRRLENMISSALKFGTTAHLAPHPRQTRGDQAIGMPALKWVYGDDVGNIERMIDVSIKATENVFPTAKHLTYDLDAGTFRNALNGRPVPFGELAGRVGAPIARERSVVGSGAGAAQAGWRTVARNALYRSIREAAELAGVLPVGRGILDRLGQNVARLRSDPDTGRAYPAEKRIFYSGSSADSLKAGAQPPAVRNPSTVDRVQAAIDELIGGQPLPNQLGGVVSTTAADIKSTWEPLIGRNVSIGSEGEGGVAQGFYEPGSKTIFLIADQIRRGDEMAVLAHELMHKHGQAALGTDGWNRLHDVLNTWKDAESGSEERTIYNYARSKVEAVGLGLSVQELAPYAVEGSLKMGIKPNAVARQGTVARWLSAVKQAMQQAWGKITGKPGSFKTQDLVNLAFGIAQMENPASATALKNAISPTANRKQKKDAPDSGGAAAFSRAAQPPLSSMGQMTPEQEQAWRNVANLKEPPTLKERALAMRSNLGMRLTQGVVDQFRPIKDVSQEAYMQARMSKGSDGTMEAALLYGKPFLRDGAPDVDVKDGGFAKVLASLKGEHDRFLWWVAAQRAERLKDEGKENLLTADDIGALKSMNAGKMADGSMRMPIYAKALNQLNDYNESVLKMALDSGLIDTDAYDLFKGQPYVPFYRVMEDDGGMKGPRFSSGLVGQQAYKKLKGGTDKLNNDLLENMLLNWSHLYSAAARNRAAMMTMDAAEKLAVAYQVPDGTKGAIKVMRDGVAQHWAVEDPYLLEAISALNYAPSPLMKPLAMMKKVLTWGVTVNPTFKIRNLIRDSVSAIAQADLGYNPAANVAKGWKLTASDSQVYASMLASGGVIKFGTQENADRLRQQVAKLGGQVLDKEGWQALQGKMSALWETYQEFGDRTENINRAALYDRLIQKGHSHAEASFMARDLMDFSMSGNYPVVRFLTQTVPFLNARLQGLYKLGRSAVEDPRRFGIVVGAVSLASLALMAGNSDDEDWKAREDWDRDAYWWFKIGGTAYRIPKPFEVGAIGTLAERTAELMFDDEMTGQRFMERMRFMVAQTFSFDPVPQAFKPLLDIYSNKDSFTGRAIESQADQRLRPQDRYNERTSEVARLLGGWGLPDPAQLLKGDWVGLSPKQVDHLLRGYFSWAATVATTVTDYAARPVAGRGERPDLRLKDAFIAGNFMESLPTGSSRYVTQMYTQSRNAEQAYASYRDAINRGDTEKAKEIQQDEAPKLRNRMVYAHATKQLSELNQQAKRIEANQMLLGDAKRQRLDELERRRVEIAKRVSSLAINP